MHTSSLEIMKRHLDELLFKAVPDVLDVGSYDVNGSYRPLIAPRGWKYTGIDAAAGPNVDRVRSVYELNPVDDGEFDLVISGQMLEHLNDPVRAVDAMKSVVRPGGTIILIAPREWPEHRYPIDCWRILSDGMRYMLRGFDIRYCYTQGHDTVGVAVRT